MKCQQCVSEGKKSKVFIDGTFATAMSFNKYYDEDGEFHSHDPNRYTTSYHCSNGHHWDLTDYRPCPNPNCEKK
jgi:hypothetical protein